MKKLKPVLNTLTFLFPLYPTLLLLYPIFLGIFIDYDLFDSDLNNHLQAQSVKRIYLAKTLQEIEHNLDAIILTKPVLPSMLLSALSLKSYEYLCYNILYLFS